MASTRSPFAHFTPSGLTRFAKAFGQAWQRRRVIGRLSALDDHMLADMGITRQDVLSSLAEPLFVDPSEKLAERASASRSARRSTARYALSGAGESVGRHAA